jgi:hypothetical protein
MDSVSKDALLDEACKKYEAATQLCPSLHEVLDMIQFAYKHIFITACPWSGKVKSNTCLHVVSCLHATQLSTKLLVV